MCDDYSIDDILTEAQVSRPKAKYNIFRRVGYDKKIIVNNKSGKDAWVILSPSPITSINSLEIKNIGTVSFSQHGEIQCQQFFINNSNEKEYDLDTSVIYYTVFFDFNGKWKCPYKNRKIDAKIYNITLTPKNLDESVWHDFTPNL
jgi:hypothetical protein